MDVLAHALGYLAAGYSLVPVGADGRKMPAFALLPREPDPADGRLKPTWKPFQDRPPDEPQARRWWSDGRCGIAFVCGAVSGGLEVIDFDREAEALFPLWLDMVRQQWPELLGRISVVRTPRPGYHVWLRCGNVETPGNHPLALLSEAERAAEKALAEAEGRKPEYKLIETRGEGGYALVPGCPPACHDRNACYVHHAGCALTALPDLSIDEREFLLVCARSLGRESAAVPAPTVGPLNYDLRPGDDFDRRGWDWAPILEAHGWALASGSAGGERRWRRPGKARGWSATTGHCRSGGSDLLRVFSSNAEPFEEGKSYGKFRAFALLNFGGDLKRAAQALAKEKFGGGAFTGKKKAETNGHPAAAPPVAQPQPPGFARPIPASLLRLADPALSWVWTGLLRRGEITLMPALWKSGKTTLLAHLLRAMREGGEFLGQALAPCRVLYVTEESESRWALRRDAVGIADNVEFLVRPFATKPDVPTWEAFLNHVGNLASPGRYDVVVFDTLANLWPLRDENDASAVQACLMPLHRMIGENAALQLVHHTRKSDGSEATASRGSGALTGFVDTIVEFRRYLPAERSDRRRVLSGYGRHDETPQELVIELLGDGRYVARGDRESVQSRDLGAVIAAILPPREPGYNAEQVVEAWPDVPRPGRDRISAALKDGASAGRWVQIGEGRRGSPYLFYKPFDDPPAAPE